MTTHRDRSGTALRGPSQDQRHLRRFQTRLLAASALSAGLAAAGFAAFAGHSGPVGEVQAASERSAAPADLQELALRSGCVLHPGTGNTDYRQGSCTAGGGTMVLLTFASTAGQQRWQAEAESYGQYLVGVRWVIGGAPELLERLRDRLGGVLEGTGTHRHAAA